MASPHSSELHDADSLVSSGVRRRTAGRSAGDLDGVVSHPLARRSVVPCSQALIWPYDA